MVDLRAEQQAAWMNGFEVDGEAKVRLALNANMLGGEYRNLAIGWLAEIDRKRAVQDRERLERNEASSSEQIRLTLAANHISKQARNAARAALVVATISMIVGILALFIVRH